MYSNAEREREENNDIFRVSIVQFVQNAGECRRQTSGIFCNERIFILFEFNLFFPFPFRSPTSTFSRTGVVPFRSFCSFLLLFQHKKAHTHHTQISFICLNQRVLQTKHTRNFKIFFNNNNDNGENVPSPLSSSLSSVPLSLRSING